MRPSAHWRSGRQRSASSHKRIKHRSIICKHPLIKSRHHDTNNEKTVALNQFGNHSNLAVVVCSPGGQLHTTAWLLLSRALNHVSALFFTRLPKHFAVAGHFSHLNLWPCSS